MRNRSLSRELNAEIFEIIHDNHHILIRYLLCCFATLKVLLNKRPKVVFCQSPSVVLAALIVLVKPIFRYTAVIDAHNGGVKPVEGKSKLLNALAKYSLKRADLVIVHNRLVAKEVRSLNVNLVILPDPLPEIDSSVKLTETATVNEITFICRWALDEPFLEVIEAARKLEKSHPHLTFNMTGKAPQSVKDMELPKNIVLKGFIDESVYNHLIANSILVIALTTRDDSLNCAAYEAMSYETPAILSDVPLLREFFDQGYGYTKNTGEDIYQSICNSLDNIEMLRENIKKKKATYSAEIKNSTESLKQRVIQE